MSEIKSLYMQMRALNQADSQLRREKANAEFMAASGIARDNGFELKRYSDTHYQIKFRHWTLSIYPGNQRLYAETHQKTKPPYIDVPSPFTLTDVVNSVIKAIENV